jgi:hypothetical protein
VYPSTFPRVRYVLVGSRYTYGNAIILVSRLPGTSRSYTIDSYRCIFTSFGTILYPWLLVRTVHTIRTCTYSRVQPTGLFPSSFTSLPIACFTFHQSMGQDAFYDYYSTKRPQMPTRVSLESPRQALSSDTLFVI